MSGHNYVDFFRFSDKYEDVFIEDNHYLYAIAEPYNWPYMMTVREYRKLDDKTYLSCEWSGADTEYLQTLEQASLEISHDILKIESQYVYKELYEEEDSSLDGYNEWYEDYWWPCEVLQSKNN